MALDPILVVSLGLNGAVTLIIGGFALRHPNPGFPIAFYLFLLLEGILIFFSLPWETATFLTPPLLLMALAITGGLALRWGTKEWVLGTPIVLAATLAATFAVYPLDLAVLLLLGGITITSALLCMEAEEVMHSVYYLGGEFLGVAGIFLLLASEFLWVVQILIYVGAVTILMTFTIMLTRREIITTPRSDDDADVEYVVRGRGLDWFMKVIALSFFLGAMLFPLIEPTWPVLPEEAVGDPQQPT